MHSQLLSRQILDIRTHSEFLQGHLHGTLHIPLSQLIDRYCELDISLPYTIVCAHGVRSIMACEFLQSKGFDALHFPGGISNIDPQNTEKLANL